MERKTKITIIVLATIVTLSAPTLYFVPDLNYEGISFLGRLMAGLPSILSCAGLIFFIFYGAESFDSEKERRNRTIEAIFSDYLDIEKTISHLSQKEKSKLLEFAEHALCVNKSELQKMINDSFRSNDPLWKTDFLRCKYIERFNNHHLNFDFEKNLSLKDFALFMRDELIYVVCMGGESKYSFPWEYNAAGVLRGINQNLGKADFPADLVSALHFLKEELRKNWQVTGNTLVLDTYCLSLDNALAGFKTSVA